MKTTVGIIWLLMVSLPVMAHHIIGGEMYYTFVEKTASGYKYKITLKLYRGCEPADHNHSLLDPYATFSIFDNDDNSFYDTTGRIPMRGGQPDEISKVFDNPCILNTPSFCYRIGYYETTVTLPVNHQGYTIAYQRCCRNNLLLNANTSGHVGATYFTVVPGNQNGIPGDNSPYLKNEESVLLCSQGNVDYTFDAFDADGDKMIFDFAPGYTGGTRERVNPVPTSPPPFHPLNFYQGFSGEVPLGKGVTIDSLTGRMHGRTHLQAGVYDITIRVRSYRGGKLIATHYRDFQFAVQDCQRTVLADIPPLYNECTSSTIQFTNNSTPGKPYVWDFGDGSAPSTEAEPVHTFKDPGTYHVWIKVDPDSPCGDSMKSVVKIFPGVKADFKKTGNCIQTPVQFADASSAPHGNNITSHHWDFGEQATLSDTSDDKNPTHLFSTAGTFPVSLTITTDSGCVQTDTQTFRFYGKPELRVTSDTMMCYKDPFHLQASSNRTGTYHWSPDYFINQTNIANPIVRPKADTTYKVVFTDEMGCVNTDSVHLRIKTKLLVEAGNDTTICGGDPVTLHASSDEQYAFTWYNSKNELIKQARNASPRTTQNETYKVVATLGSCLAQDQMKVNAVPYPNPVITPPVASICYGDSLLLRASGGAFYHWTPETGLSNTSSDSLMAYPLETTTYTLSVTDTLGCPKPADTTIYLSVVPPVQAFAGHDTIITTGQLFQLHATGGDKYEWTPATGLSDPDIPDPIVQYTKDIVYALKVTVEPEGCLDYDSIAIRYIKGPEVYVPTAFTPNDDGMNDVFRPIPVGVTKIDYFRVYNRWGQLVYQTTAYMQGWDGTFQGKPAEQGAYVWTVKAKDFQGREIIKKGSVTLVR